VLDGFDRMGIARVVKGGTARHLERQRASDDVDCSHDAMPIGGTGRLLNRHEIDDFSHPAFRQKAGHEDVGIGQIMLLVTLDRCLAWLDLEVPPFFAVQERAKDAGGIESGNAVSVNRAVFAHQRDGMQIADDAVVFDGQVGSYAGGALSLLRRGYHMFVLSCGASQIQWQREP